VLFRSSAEGVIPLSTTLDFVGPLARTAYDSALLFAALATERHSIRQKRSVLKRRFVLGLPKEFFFDVVSRDVNARFREALRRWQKAGHKINDVSIPLLTATEEAGNHVAWPEATQFHQQSGWFPARATEYSDDVSARLEMGAKVSAIEYLNALETRKRFIHQLEGALSQAGVDALVVPTTPITAPRIGEESTEIGEKQHPTRALLLRLNRPANLSGSPAISVPCGADIAGLPVGLQLIGTPSSDLKILELGLEFASFGSQFSEQNREALL